MLARSALHHIDWCAMKYTHLGRTGLKVSRIVLGTMNFGPETDEAESHTLMDAALDAGINFFDTANVYGWGANKGRTEEIIGSWFAKGGDRRDKVVLATKVYGSMQLDDKPVWPNHDKISALNIRRAVDASLKRLNTDHIDLYQFHHVDRATPWEEIWQAMDVLVQQGKVLYVGSSNHAGWNLAQANETAARRGSLGLVSEQCLYNLVERRAEMEVIPAAEAYGMGVIPWSPLGSGLLGGAIRKEREGSGAGGRTLRALENTTLREQVQAYEDLLAKHGLEPGEVGLAWLLTRPGVTGPIVGPRTREQLDSALRAVELELGEEVLSGLEEIFPGPGPSPEAFAW
ncbi:aldo/keto reductase [Streptomyces calidiresistens]